MIRNRENAMAHVAREQAKRTEVVAVKIVSTVYGKTTYPIFYGTPFIEGTTKEIKNGSVVTTTIKKKAVN